MEGGNIRYWSYFLKISPLSPSLCWFIWHFLWLNLPLKYGSHLLRHFSLQSKASMWASTPQLPCGSDISSSTSWLYVCPSSTQVNLAIPCAPPQLALPHTLVLFSLNGSLSGASGYSARADHLTVRISLLTVLTNLGTEEPM